MADITDLSDTEARATARRVDLVAGQPFGIGPEIAAMKVANPDVLTLAYVNAMFIRPSQLSDYPDDWLARDADGNPVRSRAWGNYLMQPGNPAWRDEAARQCREAVQQHGFDGCLFDMLTVAGANPNYVTAVPINPATGAPFTDLAYRDQMVAVARHLDDALPGIIVSGNSVSNGWRYFGAANSSRPIAMELDMPQYEDFLRGAGDSAAKFPSGTDYRRHVDVIADIEAAGKAAIVTTKLWASSSAADARRWERFSMTSFLLGSSGRSLFAFTPERTKAGASGQLAAYEFPADLGTPQGAYTVVDGAYRRAFSGGIAVTNPTGNPKTVPLDGSYRRLDGSTVSGSLELGPHDADILVRTGGAPASTPTSPAPEPAPPSPPPPATGPAPQPDAREPAPADPGPPSTGASGSSTAPPPPSSGAADHARPGAAARDLAWAGPGAASQVMRPGVHVVEPTAAATLAGPAPPPEASGAASTRLDQLSVPAWLAPWSSLDIDCHAKALVLRLLGCAESSVYRHP